MESTAFIRATAALVEKIELNRNTMATTSELQSQRESLQKEINQLFSGLQNPTLPSAFKLRDVAMRNGFQVSPTALNRLAQFE